jgi:hypothetical protein
VSVVPSWFFDHNDTTSTTIHGFAPMKPRFPEIRSEPADPGEALAKFQDRILIRADVCHPRFSI